MKDEPPNRPIAHYTDRREAELAHPALDISAPMPKTDFARITDSIGYPRIDWVKCQLEIDGEVCQEGHGDGWIMMRRDGVEGYIGGDCAKLHFGKDKAFASAVAKAGRDIRTTNLLVRLANLIQDREALRRRIHDVFERQQKLRKRVGGLRDVLPYAALDRLHQMSKTGDRNVRVDLGYLEKDEDRDRNVIDVVRWRPEVVGAITAPQALEVGIVEGIGKRLGTAVAACNHAEASSERSDKELRRWADAIEDVDRCEVNLRDAISSLESFVEPMNLSRLCWACRRDEDQVKVARVVLRLTGSRDVNDHAAGKARDTWRDEIMTTRKAVRFKVP
jgi:hypothetical protein